MARRGLRPALLLRSSGFVSVTLSMSARKSSHGTIFLIVSNGSPLALIASSLRSTSKKPVCPMTRSLHPPMAHCGQRVRFVATWREEFFKVPNSHFDHIAGGQPFKDLGAIFVAHKNAKARIDIETAGCRCARRS